MAKRGVNGDRDLWRGRVRYMAHIECVDCTVFDEHSATYRPVAYFATLGWRKVCGLWRCPHCAKGATDG